MKRFDLQIKIGDQLFGAVLICCAFGKISWWWFWGLVIAAVITALISKTKMLTVTEN